MAETSTHRTRKRTNRATESMESPWKSRWLENSKAVSGGFIIAGLAEVVRHYWGEILTFVAIQALILLHVIHP